MDLLMFRQNYCYVLLRYDWPQLTTVVFGLLLIGILVHWQLETVHGLKVALYILLCTADVLVASDQYDDVRY